MQFKPLHDKIIVQRLEDPAPLPGSIIIPDPAKEEPQRGDTILFGKFAGQEVSLEGVQHLIMREDEVLAAIPVSEQQEKGN